MLRIDANDMKRGSVDRHFANHRRESKNRKPRRFHAQMPDFDQRLRPVALADVQVVDVEPEIDGIKSNSADADRTMQTGGDLHRKNVPQDWRHRDCQRNTEPGHGRDDDQSPFSHSPRTTCLLQTEQPRLDAFAGALNQIAQRLVTGCEFRASAAGPARSGGGFSGAHMRDPASSSAAS